MNTLDTLLIILTDILTEEAEDINNQFLETQNQ